MWGEFSVADAIGSVGALMLCVAYFRVSRRQVDPDGLNYHLMNLAGSALLLVSLWFRPNPGAILIEAVWAAIALTALLRLCARRTR
jgi:hypothetical protein